MSSTIVILDANNVIGSGGIEVLKRHEEYAKELSLQSNGNLKLLILGHSELVESAASCNLKHLSVIDVNSKKREFIFSASKYIKNMPGNIGLLIAGDPWKSGVATLIIRSLCKRKLLVEIQLHADVFAKGWARKSFRNTIKHAIARIVISKANFVRAVSFSQAENLKKFRGVSEKSYTVPLPIQIPSNPRKQRKLSDQLVFGFLGRLHKDRGTDLLVWKFNEMLSEFPEVSLVIAGDGPERIEIERNLLDKFPKQVKLLGYLPAEASESFWDQVDVLVSFAEYESYGRVPRESICRGIPVLALPSAGILDLVNSDLKAWVGILNLQAETDDLPEICKKLVKTASELPQVDVSRFYSEPIEQLARVWMANSEPKIP